MITAADPDARPAPREENLETVESYSISVTLTLSALAFVKDYRSGLRNPETRDRLSTLEQRPARRLACAMQGPLDSFTVDCFIVDSPKGRTLTQTVSGTGHLPDARSLEDLQNLLQPVRAGLRDLELPAKTAREMADDAPYADHEDRDRIGAVRRELAHPDPARAPFADGPLRMDQQSSQVQ